MISFLLPAILAGLGIAFLAGPLGCFVVWRKMAYFGDTLAHSALLGVILGILLNVNLTFSVTLTCLLLTLVLVSFQEMGLLATDTLLGILAHSALALGLAIVSFMPNVRVDLMAYLFGDLLIVNYNDLLFIYLTLLIIGLLLFFFWRPLIAITAAPQLALVEGIAVRRYKLLVMLMIAATIAVAMKIVGILLITALLIIPAASARKLASSPESMAALACLGGAISVLFGISASVYLDTPTGPSVVLSSTCLFILVLLFTKLTGKAN